MPAPGLSVYQSSKAGTSTEEGAGQSERKPARGADCDQIRTHPQKPRFDVFRRSQTRVPMPSITLCSRHGCPSNSSARLRLILYIAPLAARVVLEASGRGSEGDR